MVCPFGKFDEPATTVSDVAGHDEDSKSAEKGRPIIRMLKMAQGMLEAVKHFKLSSGTPLQIRIGGVAEPPNVCQILVYA